MTIGESLLALIVPPKRHMLQVVYVHVASMYVLKCIHKIIFAVTDRQTGFYKNYANG